MATSNSSTSPYGMSFIQTAAGVTITGEIKRYLTYQDMITDPAPTRLASVANGSRDTNYLVPSDHIGGVLYQRDFITNTWVLLYTDKDLAVPTYIDWSHILNTPPWVGGVSNNRVKLTADTPAVPRTTYYSFGDHKLILPDASLNDVHLGDEIVLEQYSGIGTIVAPYTDGDITTVPWEIVVDPATGKRYQVIYAYAPATAVDLNDQIHTLSITGHAYSYKLICTETNDNIKYWSLITTDDLALDIVQNIRSELTAHLTNNNDPHPQYLLRNEFTIPYANESTPGLIQLAVDGDFNTTPVNGTKAVTPILVKNQLAPIITRITDIDNRVITLRSDFDGHVSDISDVVSNPNSTYTKFHVSPEDRDRWDNPPSGGGSGGDDTALRAHIQDTNAHSALFGRKADKSHRHYLNELYLLASGTYVNISGSDTENGTINCTLSQGTYISIDEHDKINCTLKPGTWIEIDETTNAINCKLKAGDNVSIDQNTGAISIGVPAATDVIPGITTLTSVITEANRNSTNTAVTPKALNLFGNILGNILNLNNHTDENAHIYPRNKFTKGCLLLPFTYTSEINNKTYNLAVEWNISSEIAHKTNSWRYLLLDEPNWYRFKQILYADCKIFPTGKSYDAVVTTNFTVDILSHHNLSNDPYADSIRSLLISLNCHSAKDTARKFRVSWFIIGLVNQEDKWPSKTILERKAAAASLSTVATFPNSDNGYSLLPDS